MARRIVTTRGATGRGDLALNSFEETMGQGRVSKWDPSRLRRRRINGMELEVDAEPQTRIPPFRRGVLVSGCPRRGGGSMAPAFRVKVISSVAGDLASDKL